MMINLLSVTKTTCQLPSTNKSIEEKNLDTIISSKFNPLPNDKILDLTKLKAFADDKSNVAKMMISLIDRVEKLWEKEKILVTSIFSFSYSVFQSLHF